jgi:hypothetical protein
MRKIEILCVVLGLLCFSTFVEAQKEPSLESRLTEAIKTKEPGWTFVVAIESARVPIVPSEKRILVAIWNSPSASKVSENVEVHIYQVENSKEAAAWLNPVRSGQVAAGWMVSSYRIGDEGYVSEYQDGKRFDIEFRRGTIVGKVAGDDRGKVKEFATRIVDQLPAK